MSNDEIETFELEYVEFIPEKIEEGLLYISDKYSTVTHLCACGCGYRVVTPTREDFWDLLEAEGKVTLHPSISNSSFACQSHYWIRNNQVVWV